MFGISIFLDSMISTPTSWFFEDSQIFEGKWLIGRSTFNEIRKILWCWYFHIFIDFSRDLGLPVKRVKNIPSFMFSRFKNSDFWQGFLKVLKCVNLWETTVFHLAFENKKECLYRFITIMLVGSKLLKFFVPFKILINLEFKFNQFF